MRLLKPAFGRFYTAVQALFHPTRLALVEPPAKVQKEEWILIYGGSSQYNFTVWGILRKTNLIYCRLRRDVCPPTCEGRGLQSRVYVLSAQL